MKFAKSEPAVAEVDMTPMIDIVFQLIAFFMVITNFEQTQADERVKLPEDQLARPNKAKRDNELVLNFGYERNADGSRKGTGEPMIFYSGKAYPVSNFQQPLKIEKETFVKTKGVAPKDVTVIIRADAEVPTGDVQMLIKLCQEVNFEKFSLRAEQKRPTG